MQIKNLTINELSTALISLCQEHGVFSCTDSAVSEQDDILESGLIDSMGVVYMQAVIQEQFNIELATELLVTELRSIKSIAHYMTTVTTNQGREILLPA